MILEITLANFAMVMVLLVATTYLFYVVLSWDLGIFESVIVGMAIGMLFSIAQILSN